MKVAGRTPCALLLRPNGGVNMISEDNFNFITTSYFPKMMEIFGWSVKDYNTYNNLAIVRADFYPIGHILGFSKKAVIVCDGNMLFIYNGREYEDFSQLYEELGDKAYDTFPDWDIKVAKEWLIKGLNGEWIYSFSNLVQMPYRTQVKC